MAKLNEYYPDEVLHPSVTLNEKLEEMGMSDITRLLIPVYQAVPSNMLK